MTELLERVHPICVAIDAANSAMSGVAETEPLYMRQSDQVEALLELVALEARTAELKARLIVSLDVPGGAAEETGARDLAFWLNQQTRVGVRGARDEISFAQALAGHPRVAAAMRAGEASRAQASVVIRAVDALPDDPPSDLTGVLAARDERGWDVATRAECQLLADAAAFDPRGLRVLGQRILEVVAPEIAEAAEARKLEAAERRARGRVRLTMRKQGDGTTRISGLLPDLSAAQRAVMLGALLNPRRVPPWVESVVTDDGRCESDEESDAGGRAPPGEGEAEVEPVGPWWALPHPHQLGQAFCEFLSRVNPADLPVHGTTATTLFVTVGLEQLQSGLGSTSEVLDLGRTRRLFSAAQKRALMITHPTCQAQGCTRPASHSEVQHAEPWSAGGDTDLANGVVLCVHHHHLAHDDEFAYERRPDGAIVFTRRSRPRTLPG